MLEVADRAFSKAIPDDEATEFFEDQTTYYRVDNSTANRIATVGGKSRSLAIY